LFIRATKKYPTVGQKAHLGLKSRIVITVMDQVVIRIKVL